MIDRIFHLCGVHRFDSSPGIRQCLYCDLQRSESVRGTRSSFDRWQTEATTITEAKHISRTINFDNARQNV